MQGFPPEAVQVQEFLPEQVQEFPPEQVLVQGFLPELPELQHRLLPHFPRLNRYRCFLRVLPEPVQGFPERFREPPRFRRP